MSTPAGRRVIVMTETEMRAEIAEHEAAIDAWMREGPAMVTRADRIRALEQEIKDRPDYSGITRPGEHG